MELSTHIHDTALSKHQMRKFSMGNVKLKLIELSLFRQTDEQDFRMLLLSAQWIFGNDVDVRNQMFPALRIDWGLSGLLVL